MKKVPAGYDRDFAHADLLKYKHFIVTNDISDEQVSQPNLYDHIANAHRILRPMCRLLDDIIEEAGVVK